MSTPSQPGLRPSLPGRSIKPFASRNSSYRALSIIDSYSTDLHLTIPQLQEHSKGATSAPLLDRHEEPQRSRKGASSRYSYGQDFDIDEAYGSAEPDLYDDDMDEIINLDQYEQSPMVSLPPRTSSARPMAANKIEAKVEVLRMKLERSPTSHDEDYDPFKAVSPPKRNPARESVRETASRSEPLFIVLNQTAPSPVVPPKDVPKVGSLLAATKSSSQLSGPSTPHSANMHKALPTVPGVPKQSLASPMDRKMSKSAEPPKSTVQQKAKIVEIPKSKPEKDVETKKDTRKDSVIQSDQDSSSATSSPRLRRSRAMTEGQWMTPRLSIEDEASISVPTGIVRTTKPISLTLSKSNGSTMPVAPKIVPFVPSRPLPSQFRVQEPIANKGGIEAVDKSTVSAPSYVFPHVASQSISAVATEIQNNNSVENTFHESLSGEPPVSITQKLLPANDDSGTTTTDISEMKRIKNLVRRKPVGSTSSASSSVISKENAQPHRSTSPTKAARAQITNAYSTHTDTRHQHLRQASYNSNAATLSPTSNQSLEAFPLLESQISSTTTVLAHRSDITRPTTPPVLRSPTPLSQLEESPSKYGLKKKSERNLRTVAEERQSQIFGQGANGVLRFLTAQKTLRDSLADDAPRSPIVDANTVIQNEAKRKSLYHATLLNYIKERPRDSNAPPLSTTQLHCHNDHSTKWHKGSNTHHPINCAMCDMEGGERWSCSSCGLRVCKECYEAIETRMENTEFNILLKFAREETERMRAEALSRRARSNTERTVTPSRPGSPVVYPPSDSDTPYANYGAAASTQSLPGMMRPRSRGPPSGQMYPPSAFNPNRIPYGRPPGHRDRTSIGSLSAQDVPPTPRIPYQYLGERHSQNTMPRSSGGSELDMRGRMGPSAEYGRTHSASRHGSPMRGPPDMRGASRQRPSRGVEIDPTAELRGPAQGPYAAIPRGTGARTPGSLR